MSALSDTYFAKIRDTITELRMLLEDLPPEHSAPIITQLIKMEEPLSNQEPPVE